VPIIQDYSPVFYKFIMLHLRFGQDLEINDPNLFEIISPLSSGGSKKKHEKEISG
jgi:hypothetical protein